MSPDTSKKWPVPGLLRRHLRFRSTRCRITSHLKTALCRGCGGRTVTAAPVPVPFCAHPHGVHDNSHSCGFSSAWASRSLRVLMLLKTIFIERALCLVNRTDLKCTAQSNTLPGTEHGRHRRGCLGSLPSQRPRRTGSHAADRDARANVPPEVAAQRALLCASLPSSHVVRRHPRHRALVLSSAARVPLLPRVRLAFHRQTGTRPTHCFCAIMNTVPGNMLIQGSL